MVSKRSRKIVLVLGSGFSKSLVGDMPGINDFFRIKYQQYVWLWLFADKSRLDYHITYFRKCGSKKAVIKKLLDLLKSKRVLEDSTTDPPTPYIKWTVDERELILSLCDHEELQNKVFDLRYPTLIGFLHKNHQIFNIEEKSVAKPRIPWKEFVIDCEKLGTFLYSYHFAEDDADQYRNSLLINEFRAYISDVIRATQHFSKEKMCEDNVRSRVNQKYYSAEFNQFLERMRKTNNELVFITFNYDTILEDQLNVAATIGSDSFFRNYDDHTDNEVFEAYQRKKPFKDIQRLIGKGHYEDWIRNNKFVPLIDDESLQSSKYFYPKMGYGFPIGSVSEYFSNTPLTVDFNSHHFSPNILLLKLHGSINWFQFRSAAQPTIDSIVIGPESNLPVRSWADYNSLKNPISRKSIMSAFHMDPVIVPMTSSKRIVMEYPLFDTIWARAYSELKSANEIYFLGYSFPETDLNTAYFFKQFKTKVKGICIYNQDEEFESRIKKISSTWWSKVTEKDAKQYLLENVLPS